VVRLDLGAGAEGDAEGDTYTSIENATGSIYDDTLYGDAGANVLNGNSGDDYIVDGAGNDTVYGGDGNDWIVATEGNTDTYDGGVGTNDILDLSAWTAALNVNLTTGKVITATTDTVKGFEIVLGSAQADTITGAAGSQLLEGNAGADTIRSMAGFDRLDGGAGGDTFVFDSVDVMDATFGWLGYDKIVGFDMTEDKLDISGMLDGITFADIDDVVSIVDDGTNTTISARYTTVNTDEVRFAVLLGVTGVSVDDLNTAGVFITA
jgi:Ca2+-binding RTX toxin-like protein